VGISTFGNYSSQVMEDSNSTASNVARAILAVVDFSSTSDTRKSAVQFLDSVICSVSICSLLVFCNRFAYLCCMLHIMMM